METTTTTGTTAAGTSEARTSEAMARAVALALRGPGRDRNPRVGCVLLAPDGQLLGEGWHRGAGTPHAEAAALAAARAAGLASRLPGATAVVTLEPCDHHGRTGPCSQALVEAGVAEVRYAVADPDPRAAGGARRLRGAGVRVHHQRDAAAEELVADWARTVRLGRPHVTWKIAGTLDGRVAAADGTSRWITSPQARAAAHELRSRVHAVVVGTGTALADDPALTARGGDGRPGPVQPLRVVVGHRDLPPGSRLLDDAAPTLHLRTHDPAEVLAQLRARGVHSVLLEGGPTLAGAFWRAGLVDELLVHLAPALLGAGASAVPDLGIGTIDDIARLDLVDATRVGPDLQLRLVPRPTHHPCPATTGTTGPPQEVRPMFTGIVEELGTLVSRTDGERSSVVEIRGPLVAQDAAHGASIAVDGVCLTVTEHTAEGFTADVMAETLDVTTLGRLAAGDRVNLERAMPVTGRLGGHVVQGHVDGTTTLLSRTPGDRWEVVRFALPPELARYVAHKGSIALDGVSLTVSAVGPDWFEVSLIPTTMELTTLGARQPGDEVNVEVDVLAKYAERLLSPEVAR